MDSNVERWEGLRTGFVSMVCLFGASLGGYRLYLDLNESGQVGHGEPVGKVERREAAVRRKLGSSYVWTKVLPNEELYLKDSIQTGPASAASIRLNDGSVLDIGESSLVVMDDTQNIALGFVRGSAVVHKADGDAKISVGKDGKAKVEELQVRLIKPESLTRFFVTGNQEVAKRSILFSWDARSNGQSANFQVQVSKDRSFSEEFTQSRSPAEPNAKQVSVELGSGNYFWRVLSGGAPQTETRQFRVIRVASIQVVYPANDDMVTAIPDQGLQFRWVPFHGGGSDSEDSDESKAKMGNHEIEIASDPQFKKIVSSTSIEVINGIATYKGLAEGKYSWRIKSTYSDLVVFSAAKTFTLKNKQQASLLPFPGAVKPDDGAVLSALNEKTPLLASWSNVEGADAYEVSVFQPVPVTPANPLGRKEIAHLKTDKTALSLKNLKLGEYLWTIRTIDKEKRPGEPMPLRGFKISQGEPLKPPEVTSQEVQ